MGGMQQTEISWLATQQVCCFFAKNGLQSITCFHKRRLRRAVGGLEAW